MSASQSRLRFDRHQVLILPEKFPRFAQRKSLFPGHTYKKRWQGQCPRTLKVRMMNALSAWSVSTILIPACPRSVVAEKTRPTFTCRVCTSGLSNVRIAQVADRSFAGKSFKVQEKMIFCVYHSYCTALRFYWGVLLLLLYCSSPIARPTRNSRHSILL